MSNDRHTPEFNDEPVSQVLERDYPVKAAAGRLGVSTHRLYK